MAVLTLSSLMRPTLNRLSINSTLVEPEQYHAMEYFLLVLCLKADLIAPYVLFMQCVCIMRTVGCVFPGGNTGTANMISEG